MKTSTSEFFEMHGLRIHVRTWGPGDAPPLFLLHGWMDFSASFQFLVDEFSRDWRFIAPDWRGFGESQWQNDSYWFANYLADLEAILDIYAPNQPVRLVGHSMGGNVACLYAGIRPERVAGLVALEGFGLPVRNSSEAPGNYAKWLDQVRAAPASKRYTDHAELALRLHRTNPRLTEDKAAFLAQHFGRETAGHEVIVACDPFHKLTSPILYRLEDAKACWRRVSAPVLWVEARDSLLMKVFHGPEGEADFASRVACFSNIRRATLEDCGHNMHHDQPAQVARLIEEFFA